MFTVMLMLATVSAVGIISSFVVTGRDGYRRQPRETFAKTVEVVATARFVRAGRCAGEGHPAERPFVVPVAGASSAAATAPRGIRP